MTGNFLAICGLTRDALNTCKADGSDYGRLLGADLDLRLICSLLADDINGWLNELAYWGGRFDVTCPEDDHHDLRYVATRCDRVSRADIREAVRDYLQDQMDDIVKLSLAGNDERGLERVGAMGDMAEMICEIFGIYVSHDDRHVYVS